MTLTHLGYFQCQVILTDTKGNEFVGSARQTKGKRTTIAFQDKHPGQVRHVKVVGRADPTNSEKALNEFILLVTIGAKTLRDSPFIRMIWFPQWKPINEEPIVVGSHDADYIVGKIGLNESQRDAVHAMVGALPLIVVHGAYISDLRCLQNPVTNVKF
jgi:regulator of nonsense transcripts 1